VKFWASTLRSCVISLRFAVTWYFAALLWLCLLAGLGLQSFLKDYASDSVLQNDLVKVEQKA
ncbi:MAG: hypothetical protein WAK31_31885, partial [Chthoniobacterales bacterium]